MLLFGGVVSSFREFGGLSRGIVCCITRSEVTSRGSPRGYPGELGTCCPPFVGTCFTQFRRPKKIPSNKKSHTLRILDPPMEGFEPV